MNFFGFPLFSRRPPISTGAELPPRSLPPDSDGIVTTMAKGVNDLLNYYIQVIDTKASIMIAGNVASATFLLSAFPSHFVPQLIYVLAATLLGSSLVMATLVVLPRIPARARDGCLFWGDIAASSSAAEYRDRFGNAATAGVLDDEYSILNFHTAKIIFRKVRMLRQAILTFLSGVVFAVVHHVVHG